MTTDVMKFRNIEKTALDQDGAASGIAIFRELFKGGIPQDGAHNDMWDDASCESGNTEDGKIYDDGFVGEFARGAQGRNGAGDEAVKLISLLEKQALEQDGHNRAMGATVALLKYAHKMIERAEDTIQAQEKRIGQLEKLATSDDLTGIKNRRGFFDAFMRELEICGRGHSHGGLLVLIDLDNFKVINDKYGHMAGDACLRLVARTLDSNIRAMDVAARLGGDEFVLLLSNTSKESAAGRAQQLAWQLNHLSMAWYGDEIPVRASLGLRPYGPGDKAEHIFNAADVALYAEKKSKESDAERSMKA